MLERGKLKAEKIEVKGSQAVDVGADGFQRRVDTGLNNHRARAKSTKYNIVHSYFITFSHCQSFQEITLHPLRRRRTYNIDDQHFRHCELLNLTDSHPTRNENINSACVGLP